MDIEAPSPEDDPIPSKSKADEAALELMKQLITLASGVLALGAAFIDKLPKTPKPFLMVLFLSWVGLILSLIFGLQTISAIVKSRLESDDEWSRGRGRTYGRISRYGFLAGIGLFAAFAFLSLALPSNGEKEIKITIKADDPAIVDILNRAAAAPLPTATAASSSPTPQSEKQLPAAK